MRVTTDRRGFAGGTVERCDGPWRSSGDWWAPCAAAAHETFSASTDKSWNCDEWDVTLSDGASYRVSRCIAERERAHTEREVAARVAGASRDHLKDAWFIDGVLD